MSKKLMLEAAVGYAANGFPVLPVKQMGKVPAIVGGYKVATAHPNLANEWWEKPYAGCNIGIATGDASGF